MQIVIREPTHNELQVYRQKNFDVGVTRYALIVNDTPYYVWDLDIPSGVQWLLKIIIHDQTYDDLKIQYYMIPHDTLILHGTNKYVVNCKSELDIFMMDAFGANHLNS